MRVTVNLPALVILVGFAALLILGLSVQLGIIAIIAATIIDWLFVVAPLLPGRGSDRTTR